MAWEPVNVPERVSDTDAFVRDIPARYTDALADEYLRHVRRLYLGMARPQTTWLSDKAPVETTRQALEMLRDYRHETHLGVRGWYGWRVVRDLLGDTTDDEVVRTELNRARPSAPEFAPQAVRPVDLRIDLFPAGVIRTYAARYAWALPGSRRVWEAPLDEISDGASSQAVIVAGAVHWKRRMCAYVHRNNDDVHCFIDVAGYAKSAVKRNAGYVAADAAAWAVRGAGADSAGYMLSTGPRGNRTGHEAAQRIECARYGSLRYRAAAYAVCRTALESVDPAHWGDLFVTGGGIHGLEILAPERSVRVAHVDLANSVARYSKGCHDPGYVAVTVNVVAAMASEAARREPMSPQAAPWAVHYRDVCALVRRQAIAPSHGEAW